MRRNGDIYIADMHHNRIRKVDAKTHIITTVAGSGAFGNAGDGGPATRASLAGPAGIALMPEAGGKMTIFIADYYNGTCAPSAPTASCATSAMKAASSSARLRAWRSRRGSGGCTSPTRASTGWSS